MYYYCVLILQGTELEYSCSSRVQSSEFRVQSSEFRVQSSEFRATAVVVVVVVVVAVAVVPTSRHLLVGTGVLVPMGKY